ncbi:MAG: XRE family transcriptional regulator, partial [Neisseria sp.]
MKKREISDIEKEECKLLKQLFNDRKKELGLSQAKIADLIGVTQAAINHYLNGTNALNASIASEFAKVLGVPVGSFSWRLEKEINEMSNSLIISGGVINGTLHNNIGGVHNNTSYTLNQNSVSKPTEEELADADKHFLKSMPLLDIDIAVRHLSNPDKDRTQIQGNGD